MMNKEPMIRRMAVALHLEETGEESDQGAECSTCLKRAEELWPIIVEGAAAQLEHDSYRYHYGYIGDSMRHLAKQWRSELE